MAFFVAPASCEQLQQLRYYHDRKRRGKHLPRWCEPHGPLNLGHCSRFGALLLRLLRGPSVRQTLFGRGWDKLATRPDAPKTNNTFPTYPSCTLFNTTCRLHCTQSRELLGLSAVAVCDAGLDTTSVQFPASFHLTNTCARIFDWCFPHCPLWILALFPATPRGLHICAFRVPTSLTHTRSCG